MTVKFTEVSGFLFSQQNKIMVRSLLAERRHPDQLQKYEEKHIMIAATDKRKVFQMAKNTNIFCQMAKNTNEYLSC